MRRVMAALDGSVRAAGVLDAALEVAFRFGATLRLLRAVFVPPEFPAAGAGTVADPLPAYLVRRAHEELGLLLSHASIRGVMLEEAIVRIGKPSQIILDSAEEHDVDLIVVGSHGYHTLDRILGTTAGRVANLAHRNVLVVHGDARALAGTGPLRAPYR